MFQAPEAVILLSAKLPSMLPISGRPFGLCPSTAILTTPSAAIVPLACEGRLL